jgi:rhamnosyltransferase
MISIIIPTLNASQLLPGLLTKLEKQTFRDKEIIIIDSSSDDHTAEIAQDNGIKAIQINKEDFDHGGTRNIGAKEAKGDILVFMTQDAMPADEYTLENLTKPFSSNNDIAAVFGRQLPNPDAPAISAHLRLFNYPETSYTRELSDRITYGLKTAFLSDSFSAYKRESLEKIGWFKEGLLFGEDTHAAARLLLAEHKIAYAADAMVYHSHDYTPAEEFRRYFDVGVFHKTEEWLIKEFGSAQGEGKKYIQSGVSYLMKHKKSDMPSFMFRNALKYLGYNLGLRYKAMPVHLAVRCSMNRNWWRGKVT